MKLDKDKIQLLDFNKIGGLVPVIIQDCQSGVVLMLGYMNQESLVKTFDTGKVTFFSRSRQGLWTKGETSGNYLLMEGIWVNCDKDTLLIKAKPIGPVCHLGTDTCFDDGDNVYAFLHRLEYVIKERKENRSEKSYTAKLFNKGLDKIAQKVGEEAVELVIEAKNDDRDKFLGEAADLLFHTMVLLEVKEHSLAEVIEVLIKRHHEG